MAQRKSKRSYKNYFGQVALFREDGEMKSRFEILNAVLIFGLGASLTFEGWKSTDDFDNGEQPDDDLRVQLHDANPAIRSQIETAAIDLLVTGEKNGWKLLGFGANFDAKTIEFSVVHTSGAKIIEKIETEDAFDALVANHPEIVGLIIQYGWSFGKDNNDLLKNFKAVE